MRSGVRALPDINAIATRKDREIEDSGLELSRRRCSLPCRADRSGDHAVCPPMQNARLLEHFRVDSDHSNSFTAWKEMGSPQSPSESEYKRLESAGQLQLLNSPAWMEMQQGSVQLQFTLPRQSLSLVRVAW